MLILGVDFETTGLLPEEDRIIEVGAVLWNTEKRIPVQVMSEFIDPERPIPEEITAITGITNDLIQAYGNPEAAIIGRLADWVDLCDYVMAHNGTTFDKLFFDAAMERTNIFVPQRLWLDSKIDIRFPEAITTRNLRHLAAEHNFLNPFSHRAIFDVLTMLKVASEYDWQATIARAQEPTLFVQALVSYDDREKAKGRGYYWCAPQKMWWRTFKQSDYLADKEVCGFRTVLLQGAPE